MLTPFFLIDILIAISFLCIGGVVLLKNSRIILNRLFFCCVSFLAAWMVTNYLSNDQSLSSGAARTANHLVLFFSGMAVLFLLKFVIAITSNKFLSRHEQLITYINYSILFLTLTPLVVSGISRQGNVYAIQFGQLANIYFLSLFANVIFIIGALFVGIRKRTGEDRLKIVTILWSLGLMLAINITTNAIIPLISGSFNLTNIGPLTSIILVAGLSYTIVKHRLFDIQLVIARSVGYLLSLLSLGVIYGLTAFIVLNGVILKNDRVSTSQGLLFTLVAVILSFTFHPLRQFFDRVTNHIFFRDAYDTQDFLNGLNKVLVSEIDLRATLINSSKIISSNLKSTNCYFLINKTNTLPERIFNIDQNKILNDDLARIKATFPEGGELILLTDFLEEKDIELKKVLISNDIGVVAKLTTSSSLGKQSIGLLLLGNKRSGNPYGVQDAKVIEIIVNELVIAIQNAIRFEEIQQFNITLQQKIDDATHQLRKANDKLRALDETKDEFISMASHQLRTPLTSVKGYVSMVLEGDAGKVSSPQKKLLDQAFMSSQRMVYLIADLLNVSRLRTGKFVIDAQPTNLADMVEGEINQLTETAKGRGLELTFAKPKDFPTLMLDETKTRQVIMNFADNAIYYTPSGGHISVNLAETPESIEFTVVDDGLGVPKHDQHHMFTKFFRAGNAKKARPDGTGLGLFMAKKVIIAQGGAIIFSSTEGKGSTFGFSFPKAKLKVNSPAASVEHKK